MVDEYVDAIRFEEVDGLKSIVLKACQSDAELIITRQPDGEISFAATEGSRQFDFAITPGELGALSLRWLGLSSITAAQPAPDFCDKHCTWTDHHPDCERHTSQGEDA